MGDDDLTMSPRTRMTLGVSLKLYLDMDDTLAWARAVSDIARAHPAVLSGDVRIFVLPSLPALHAVGEAIADTPIALGAQDLFWADRGAYTGGVSGADLKSVGCRFVEVGHAERREYFGEDDDVARNKLAAAVRNGLTPVLCVGEQERQAPDLAADTCIAQLDRAVSGVDGGEIDELVVAYEPEWAIGKTEPAAPAHVDHVSRRLREHLRSRDGIRSSSVIYGGSAKPGLIATLGADVEGLFLGRFAHDPSSFAQIIDEAAERVAFTVARVM